MNTLSKPKNINRQNYNDDVEDKWCGGKQTPEEEFAELSDLLKLNVQKKNL